MVAQVKKADRKYWSNYYLSEPVLAGAVERGEMTYVYKDKEYLNLWRQKEYFKQLYFFVANRRNFKVNSDSAVFVSDIVGRENNMSGMCELLSNAGMVKYAVYRKWVCSNPPLLDIHRGECLQIVDDDKGELFAEGLQLYFDKWSDMLPDKNEWNEFVRSRRFIGVHDLRNQTLAAGLIYTKQGSVITEEFVFVHSDYRRQGISKWLHNALYQKYAGEKIKYIAWIRNNNLESRSLHSHYNYEEQDLFKITFVNHTITAYGNEKRNSDLQKIKKFKK